MPRWHPLETTDSIVEVLWDVALAVFAVRLGLLYCALTFLILLSSSIFLSAFTGPSSVTPPHDQPQERQQEYLTSLFMLASSAAAARFVIRRCDVPRAPAFRLAIGVVAAIVAVLVRGVAELAVDEVCPKGEEGWKWTAMVGTFLWECLATVGGGKGGGWGLMRVGVLGGFALMPVAMIGWEKWCEKWVAVVLGKRKTGDTQRDVSEKVEVGKS
ncbi:hypothetical protein C7999DRAFT_27488 [Corynascus novoguineensis]|uniref:Uncharacterized protein n=1 Tax=Corynascus novoguineensis TaxID=1126955 RepID=A0AAN7HV05_9PEZI|nr:hypothetical protein C7999DRAFT_27488 [Corynascus novoguineensis]